MSCSAAALLLLSLLLLLVGYLGGVCCWHLQHCPQRDVAAENSLACCGPTAPTRLHMQAQHASIDAQSTATLIFQLRMETDQATNSSCKGAARCTCAACLIC